MRGDPSDNIFSAYPGVRTKGTKNKIGLTEAFEDRNSKGYTLKKESQSISTETKKK